MRKGSFTRLLRLLLLLAVLGLAFAQDPSPSDSRLKLVDVGKTGIDVKRPVFAGACKACPWGVLAEVTRAAMKYYDYDVQVCWPCWSSLGPREMGDKTKPVVPQGAASNIYVDPTPDAVPDIGATSEINLLDAWNGEGVYASDHKQRRNYRIVAVVQQPNFLLAAASKKSGITDLAQVKD